MATATPPASIDPSSDVIKEALTSEDIDEEPTIIPIIDVAPFFTGEAPENVAKQVEKACREVGFLVIVGHGIDLGLPKACASAAYNFFGRSEDEKSKVAANGRAYGFFPLSSEALGYDADVGKRPDIREAFSMGPQEPLPPEGSPERPGGPKNVVDFCYQTTPWPEDPPNSEGPGLREAMQRYYEAAGELADKMLHIFAKALSVDPSEMLAKTKHHASSLRVIHYPALTEKPLPGQLRCGAHADICTMTLLWQDVHGGLEVLPRGKKRWVEVQCPPEGLIVNIGDLFARWTNDKWQSTPHRVACPEIAYKSSRISMPYFQILRSDAEIKCFDSCLENGEAKHPPTTQGEDLHRHFTRWGRNRE